MTATATAEPQTESGLKITGEGVSMPMLSEIHPTHRTAIKLKAAIDRIDTRHNETIAERKDLRAELREQGKEKKPGTCQEYVSTEFEIDDLKQARTAFDKQLSDVLGASYQHQGDLFAGVDEVVCAVTGRVIDNEELAAIADEMRTKHGDDDGQDEEG